MSDPKPKEKVEEESQRDIKRTPEYRKFRKLLKKVIKAPPMRKNIQANPSSTTT
jgi:hypothetical protein